MKDYFYQLADHIQSKLTGNEFFTTWFEGERSTFCRFNHARVRQLGDVHLNQLRVRLIDGKKSVMQSVTLSGDADHDRQAVSGVVTELRGQIPSTPEDPYLLYATEVRNTESVRENEVPPAEDMISHIASTCEGDDLVGIFAAGPIMRGFANSAGQRNWHETTNFHFDYSLYHAGDKAVKGSYAGFGYDEKAFADRIRRDREQLAVLKKPARDLKPGKYRAYLAPSALDEITGTLSWGGFGKKAFMTKRSVFLKMVEENVKMADTFTLSEDTAQGVAPLFNADGYIKPNQVDLIKAGRCEGALVSARSAKEYDVKTNGATGHEMPESLAVAAGQLEQDKVLQELGTGIYINNLWYLNFSDRQSCRLTGMTRFASFWVENGVIQDPLNVMRFDESMFRLFGDHLVGLTKERDFLPSAATYGGRSTDSAYLPGALVSEFSLTL